MRRIIFSAIICVIASAYSLSVFAQAEAPTGILGASAEEVMLLESAAANAEEQYIEGIRFFSGEIEGRPVIIARTGVGKVNAAMIATLLIEHFKPSEVIMMGVAGGTNPDLLPGDIVIAERTAQHDLGSLTPQGVRHWGVRNPRDGERNPVFFPGDSLLVALAEQAGRGIELEPFRDGNEEHLPRIVRGVVATGDVFVSSSSKRNELYRDLRADAVEMEGAAVAQICWQHGVPCLVIRCLSDTADEEAGRDYENFYQIAARNSASFVLHMIEQLASKASTAGEKGSR